MRVLVISDIHANITALEAVLADAGAFDAAWCLGDLVGYGPDPNECVALIRTLPQLACVIGNHDAAVLHQIDTESFNPEARQAITWTQRALNQASINFLSSLPERIVEDNVTLTHGSPRHPVWEYLLDTRAATSNFSYFDTPFCLVGHTHLPVFFTLLDGNSSARLNIPEPNNQFTLQPRGIVNPGSVGQPRDRDPRASYAIIDPESVIWEYRRIKYDIPAVQQRMIKAGLPERHILRLEAGW